MTGHVLTIADMCPCEPLPVNVWQLPDETWVIGAVISMDGLPDDVADYRALGCVAWVIACPECGRLFAAGAPL